MIDKLTTDSIHVVRHFITVANQQKQQQKRLSKVSHLNAEQNRQGRSKKKKK